MTILQKRRSTIHHALVRIVNPVIAICFALLIAAVFMLLFGFEPISLFTSVMKGAFGSRSACYDTLFRMTPILFTGLAYAVSSRVGAINIGIEGQLCAGGFFAALAGLYITDLPAPFHVIVCLAVGMLGGGIFAAIIAFLKLKFDANEFVTSIMFNLLIVYIIDYFVSGPLRDPGDVPQTPVIQETARLTMLSPRNQLTTSILIAIVLSFLLYFVFRNTVFGFEMKVVGLNQGAAGFSGINANQIFVKSLVISGMIAGVCGATIIMGSMGRYIASFSPGYGYEGVAVSALAGANPIGCIFSSLLFGGLKAGVVRLNITSRVPTEFVDLIQALIIIFIAAPKMIERFRGGLRKCCFFLHKTLFRRKGADSDGVS